MSPGNPANSPGVEITAVNSFPITKAVSRIAFETADRIAALLGRNLATFFYPERRGGRLGCAGVRHSFGRVRGLGAGAVAGKLHTTNGTRAGRLGVA